MEIASRRFLTPSRQLLSKCELTKKGRNFHFHLISSSGLKDRERKRGAPGDNLGDVWAWLPVDRFHP